MKKEPPFTAEDLALFRKEVEGTEPLNCDRIAPQPPQLSPLPRLREPDEAPQFDDLLSDTLPFEELETEEELFYARPGLQRTILQKLKRGLYPPIGQLDLHGMTVAEARPVLGEFLRTHRYERYCCLRIIHGKGNRSLGQKPVLKWKLNYWLRQREEVLAFCSARPHDGGTGAIYLLLRAR